MRFGVCVLAVFLAASGLAHAELDATARAEVDHLLAFIRSSDCEFVRNGRSYGGERAYWHVMRKFNYFEDEIDTAEDFIEYSATQSTVSGRPYLFVCNGQSEESKTVLLAELARYRRSR